MPIQLAQSRMRRKRAAPGLLRARESEGQPRVLGSSWRWSTGPCPPAARADPTPVPWSSSTVTRPSSPARTTPRASVLRAVPGRRSLCPHGPLRARSRSGASTEWAGGAGGSAGSAGRAARDSRGGEEVCWVVCRGATSRPVLGGHCRPASRSLALTRARLQRLRYEAGLANSFIASSGLARAVGGSRDPFDSLGAFPRRLPSRGSLRSPDLLQRLSRNARSLFGPDWTALRPSRRSRETALALKNRLQCITGRPAMSFTS